MSGKLRRINVIVMPAIVAPLLALAVWAGAPAESRANSPRVTMACASDYFAYCSRHPTQGPGVRQCMRANGHKLSQRCVDALIAAGEVSKAEVTRRSASAR